MRNENQEIFENNKRNCAKKDVLKVERPLFILKLVDNFAIMTLDERKFDWKVSKYFYSQNTIFLPYLEAIRFRFEETRKLTEYLDSDKILFAKKIAFQSRLENKSMSVEMSWIFIEKDAFNLHISSKALVDPAKTEVFFFLKKSWVLSLRNNAK